MNNFKKLLPFLLIISVFLSCSTSKQGRTVKNTIDGNWTLQTINTEGINSKFTAKIFNEADMNCFIGSNWNFIANNSMGSYSLENSTANCTMLQRKIRWSIYEEKNAPMLFQFKRLDDKKNPLDDNNGFRLSINMVNTNTMQLKSPITFEGKTATLIYNFVRK